MRKPRELKENVWYKMRPAVTHFSSAAVSLPPHRGAFFKQCSQCFGRSVGRSVI
jgi:hypothetical protein